MEQFVCSATSVSGTYGISMPRHTNDTSGPVPPFQQWLLPEHILEENARNFK